MNQFEYVAFTNLGIFENICFCQTVLTKREVLTYATEAFGMHGWTEIYRREYKSPDSDSYTFYLVCQA